MTRSTDSSKKSSSKRSSTSKTAALNEHQPTTEENTKLLLKLKEANSVIEKKINILSEHKLSYLEYVEMQEELCRLKEYKGAVEKRIAGNTKNPGEC